MKKIFTILLFVLLANNYMMAQNLVSYNMSTAADDKYLYYKVKSGDNLTAIAAKYSTTVAVLQTLNTGININTIKIGQTIVVPKTSTTTSSTTVKVSDTPIAKTTTSSTTTTITPTTVVPSTGSVAVYHKVVSGETLYGICSKCGATVTNVKLWNNITDINNIVVGKNLIVGYKSGTASTTTTSTQISTTANNSTAVTTTSQSTTTTATVLQKPTNPDDFSNVNTTTATTDVTNDALISITEKGIASWTKSSSDDGNYYALHKSAPIGTTITIKNLNNGKTLNVKVIGKLPDTGSNQNVIIKISGSAAQNLGILDDKVLVQLSYMGLKPAGK